jgi:hypothetical protein
MPLGEISNWSRRTGADIWRSVGGEDKHPKFPVRRRALPNQKLKTSTAAKAADTVPSVIAKKMKAPSLMHSSVAAFDDSCSL